jgi:hypothetical protein
MPAKTKTDKNSFIQEALTLLREINALLRSIADDVRKIKMNTS